MSDIRRWRRSPALPQLRERLREEYLRPRLRWSDLAYSCSLVTERDQRPAHRRVAEVAARQTHLRYGDV